MVINKTNYNKLADYYDLIYSITPPNDGVFYKKYIDKNTEVLEMGIGTGRVFLNFFDLGVKWTGIDLSLIHISSPRDGLLSRMPSSA